MTLSSVKRDEVPAFPNSGSAWKTQMKKINKKLAVTSTIFGMNKLSCLFFWSFSFLLLLVNCWNYNKLYYVSKLYATNCIYVFLSSDAI